MTHEQFKWLTKKAIVLLTEQSHGLKADVPLAVTDAIFESRRRNGLNTEVHLSHGDLLTVIRLAFELQRIERQRPIEVEKLCEVAHDAWRAHMHATGIESRPSVDGVETMVPFDELPEGEKQQPRTVVRAILGALS